MVNMHLLVISGMKNRQALFLVLRRKGLFFWFEAGWTGRVEMIKISHLPICEPFALSSQANLIGAQQ